MLNIVPAKVAGTWRTGDGREFTLTQQFQMLTGTSRGSDGQTVNITGRLRGNDMMLSTGKQEFNGRVKGSVIEGTQKATGGGGATQQLTLTKVK
jgi:hypothetical protein